MPRIRPAFLLVAVFAAVWLLWPRAPERWAIRNAPAGPGAIVCFGDSLTSGFGAPPEQSYPNVLAALLARPVVNRGLNGDTTEAALERLDEAVLSLDPAVVLITLGGNDMIRGLPVEGTVRSLREIFTRLLARGAVVVFLAVDPPFVGNERMERVRALARELGVGYVDDVMAGLWGDPARMADRIHPNAAGYRVLAERARDAIAGLL